VLAVGANLLSAPASNVGDRFYMLVYTHWLKRHSTQNIVIGGAAGAIPAIGLGCVYWTLLGSVGNFAIVFLDSAALWALALMIVTTMRKWVWMMLSLRVMSIPLADLAIYSVKCQQRCC